jgi:N-acetylneuraminate synthase/sialic acid synthase
LLGKPVIVSTGGGTFADVDAAVDILDAGPSPFALLHCTASYPVWNYAELNLLAIVEMRARYPGIVIGWSGHDNGIAMAMVAYAYGARIIERHFTLNRASKGTDHAFSLEPGGMQKMCRDLERAHEANGDGIKRLYESERKPLAKMRRRETPDGLRVTGELPSL